MIHDNNCGFRFKDWRKSMPNAKVQWSEKIRREEAETVFFLSHCLFLQVGHFSFRFILSATKTP